MQNCSLQQKPCHMRFNFFLAVLLANCATLNAQLHIGGGAVGDLYKQHCANCHGQNLEGGQGVSLVDDEWKHGNRDADIANVISNGVVQMGMVPFRQVLSADQIRALVVFIREKGQMARQEARTRKLAAPDGIYHSELHNFKLEKVASGEGTLWAIDALPDGRLLATQKSGKLWLFDKDFKPTEITGIPSVWDHGQGGLLDVGVHPDYAKNGWIYLSFSESRDDKTGITAIVRGKLDGKRWVQQEEIFHVPVSFHSGAGVHFGSRFVFQNGYLYFSIGERGAGKQAQDTKRPNGKIHRIFDDGRIPDDNPFAKEPGAYKSIWCYGNRNPQGLDADPVTGQLWETEHGPRGGDEVNLIEPGKNYGWPEITYGINYDGKPISDKTAAPGLEQPKHYWTPSIAVCGIDFYVGARFPKWKNNLMVGGLASEELHRLVIKDGGVTKDEILFKGQGRVRDVLSAPDGNLYVILNGDREKEGIYRLSPAD